MPTAAAAADTTLDLFPETAQPDRGHGPVHRMEFAGQARCQYGHPIVRAALIGMWDTRVGWTVGWLVQVGSALDEWHPGNPNAWKARASYPWYRLDTGMPRSSSYAVAAGNAARAAKLVLAKMTEFCPPEAAGDIEALSDQLETRAREWLCQ